MGTIRYAMIQSEGHWRLVGPRRSFAQFDDLDSAAAVALKLAATARLEGWDVELLVQERFGMMQPFKPPAGFNLALRETITSLEDVDPKALPTKQGLTVSIGALA